ncbi:MAG: hypothetical protein Q8K75_11240 [Chlamydiales bacterium]|nr:hypothetical protein [Chlamydiales bacterium]
MRLSTDAFSLSSPGYAELDFDSIFDFETTVPSSSPVPVSVAVAIPALAQTDPRNLKSHHTAFQLTQSLEMFNYSAILDTPVLVPESHKNVQQSLANEIAQPCAKRRATPSAAELTGRLDLIKPKSTIKKREHYKICKRSLRHKSEQERAEIEQTRLKGALKLLRKKGFNSWKKANESLATLWGVGDRQVRNIFSEWEKKNDDAYRDVLHLKEKLLVHPAKCKNLFREPPVSVEKDEGVLSKNDLTQSKTDLLLTDLFDIPPAEPRHQPSLTLSDTAILTFVNTLDELPPLTELLGCDPDLQDLDKICEELGLPAPIPAED